MVHIFDSVGNRSSAFAVRAAFMIVEFFKIKLCVCCLL